MGEKKKEKQAIALTAEQMAQANKLGASIYGLSFLGFVLLMIMEHDISVVAIVAMVICYVACLFLALTKGTEEKTHTLMSVTFLIGFIVTTFASHADIYPIVFAAVYALVIYQNVVLVKCGAFATCAVNIIHCIMCIFQGVALSDVAVELVSTVLFTYFSVSTVLRIYKSTKENMDQIQVQTEEAVQVANQVSDISQSILENFHQITDGMEIITEQASENKGAMMDITSASENNSQEMNNQSNLTQNIYAIVEETQANATHVQENADVVYEKVEEGVVLSVDMKSQSSQVTEGIEETYKIISELVAQIQGVSSITDAILSISSQTNLLALNASIEAARAGEAGKGFAVVADEIRTLAEQTKTSTEEITQIMNQLISVANQSVKTLDDCVEGIKVQNTKIEDVNSSFEETKQNVFELRDMVAGIIDGINEISTNTANIVDSVVSVSETTDRVSELSDNGVTGAEMIFDKIQEFSNTISALRDQVNELQDTVNAN